MNEIAPRDFRDAMGTYPTGVTVVTTLDENDEPVGMTVNSFTSLSLDPPLVLWNPGRDSFSFPIFERCQHFAVHVLHSGQEELSNRFALRSKEKFGDLDWQAGDLGSPLLPDFAACLQCATLEKFPGGDHIILVGKVVHLERREFSSPLIYYQGGYRSLTD